MHFDIWVIPIYNSMETTVCAVHNSLFAFQCFLEGTGDNEEKQAKATYLCSRVHTRVLLLKPT